MSVLMAGEQDAGGIYDRRYKPHSIHLINGLCFLKEQKNLFYRSIELRAGLYLDIGVPRMDPILRVILNATACM